jgi:hypothetical protein
MRIEIQISTDAIASSEASAPESRNTNDRVPLNSGGASFNTGFDESGIFPRLHEI